MGRVVEEMVALFHRFAHQCEFAGLQIAQAAMDQSGRRGARAGAEVALVDEERRHALCREIAKDADPVDAAAKNDDAVPVATGSELVEQRPA